MFPLMLLAELSVSHDAFIPEVKIDTVKPIVDREDAIQNQVISVTPQIALSPDSDIQQPEFTSSPVESSAALLEQLDSVNLPTLASETTVHVAAAQTAVTPSPLTYSEDIETHNPDNRLSQQPDLNRDRFIQFDSKAVGSVGLPIAQRRQPDPNRDRSSQFDFEATGSLGVPIAQRQQPDPNRDRLIQPDTEPPSPLPRAPEPVLPQSPDAQPIPSGSEQPADAEQPQITIFVRRIEVVGSTVFGPEDFNPIVQPLEGREVTLQQLTDAANAITQLYLTDGYVTSRAVLGEQEIVGGVVQIQVIEGGVQEIQITGNQRLNSGYIRSRLQLGTDTPLKAAQLEDQLRLLQADPLIEQIRGRLQPGEGIGETVLVVEVEEANPFRFGFNFDNYSPPSVGSERTGVSVGYLNLTGNGDSLSGSYNRSTTGGSNVWDVSYRIPVNPMNGSVQLRAVFDDFDASSSLAEGNSERYEISYRQPLIRSTREELALSFGFSYRDGQTFFGDMPVGFGIGPDLDTGVSRTSVIRVGQDYVRRDTQGAWALRSQFNIGVGLFDATNNTAPIPDSEFLSWLGQIQRVQRLSSNNLLILQADVQLANDGLLSSEQFVIGGGQSLRGYRQNARAGDNGFRFSIEDRITLMQDQPAAELLQIAPFVDIGSIWNDSDNPNNPSLPDQRFLAGAGMGVLWQPVESLNIRLDYGVPLVDISDEGDNLQEDGFYFSLNYQF